MLEPGSTLTGCPAGAAAWAIAQSYTKAWVVVPDQAEAERLAAELRWWGKRALVFPADDHRPYDVLNPHPDIPRRRLEALAALKERRGVLIVAPATAMLHKVPPLLTFTLKKGQTLGPEELARKLAERGYMAVQKVEDPGTFSRRGEQVEIYERHRLRVEFFDDEVDELRVLDDERRTIKELDTARLLPVREEYLHPASVKRASALLRERVADLGYGARLRREVLEDFGSGIRFSGSGAWLPALSELTPPNEASSAPIIVLDRQTVMDKAHSFWDSAVRRHAALSTSDRPLVGPSERYVPANQLVLEGASIELLGLDGAEDLGCKPNTHLHHEGDLAPVVGQLHAWVEADWKVGIVVDSTSRADRLKQLFLPHGLRLELIDEPVAHWPRGQVVLVRGDLPRGFHHPDTGLAVLTADDLLGEKQRNRGSRRGPARKDTIASHNELRQGELIVHERHGVGRFVSLQRIDVGNGREDMVELEYRGGDRMFLPVYKLDALYAYRKAGEGREPRLDKLGGDSWTLRKSKVKDAVLKLAHELLQLQAARTVHGGRAFDPPTSRFRQFEDAFPYVETDDQFKAINEVLEDLLVEAPMDRLIVGDAGFGKTEVAMRAAFRAVEQGLQVALLCPTTVLAYQHARTFAERFEPFGIRVALLSRFGDAKSHRKALSDAKKGEVDILIGTTRLLGRGVKFKNLGLVVVDEEHRFGVKQKARLKQLRTEVDYLAMSATPIPRSLHMAMTGIRGFSIISTPPLDRLPVTTLVAKHGVERIREDLMRELRRGGQVFFVHNRVASIGAVATQVREAVPEAKVVVAHGQMADNELESVLVEFVERRADVLVCTAIIESGVDMPNVNTIVVNEADQFGLAQLYQLRGRVGRSHRRGFCTLMINPDKKLTRQAMRRLRVLQEHIKLGSGFMVATADLELRGAGDLLGDQQHGHIDAVGFETYMRLLEEAMDEARGNLDRRQIDPEIDVPVATYLPEAWVEDVQDRLGVYKNLTSARTLEELRRVSDSLEQEYGEMPDPAHAFTRLLELKLRARELGISRISVLQVRVILELADASLIPPERVVALAQRMPKRISVTPSRMEVRFTPDESEQPFLFVHWVLDLLQADKPA
jgi:transcription-repair coupling factor (superfamily II helicase)